MHSALFDRLILVVAFTLMAGSISAQVPSQEDLLQKLKTLDAQLENYAIEFDRMEKRMVTREIHRLGTKRTVKLSGGGTKTVRPESVQYLPPHENTTVKRCRFANRANEAVYRVLVTDVLRDGEKYPQDHSIGSSISTSTLGGKGEMLTRKIGSERATLTRNSATIPGSILDTERRMFAFCLGYGFGSRLQAVESITRDDDGQLLVKGTLDLGWADKDAVTLCEIRFDSSLIARSATLYTQADHIHWRTRVTTQGIYVAEGLPPLAAEATFERDTLQRKANVDDPIAKYANESTWNVSDKFDFELVSAKRQSEAEFKQHAELTAPNLRVFDRSDQR